MNVNDIIYRLEEPDRVPPMPALGEGERLLVTGSTHEGYGFRRSDDPEVQQRLVIEKRKR